jgi:hypothetical protein
VRVLSDENIVLLDGGVPGPRNGVIVMKGANKKARMPLPEPRAKTDAVKEAPEASEEG